MKAQAMGLALVALAAIAGCHDDIKTVDAGAIDAGGPQVELGSKLDQALASAEQQGPSAPKSGAGGDGPPENGVFTVAAADKAMPRNTRPKVEIVSDGADPKQVLVLKPGDETRATVTTQMAQQGRAKPALAISFSFKVDKPKKDAPTDVFSIIAKVLDANARDAGSPNPLAKLKGAEVHYQLGNDGAISNLQVGLPKDADPALGEVLTSAADVIIALTPVLPKKPVGQGAYWMVTDRPAMPPFDLVRYRLFKIEKINKDGVTFSIDVRSYLAGDQLDAGRGQKFAVAQFEGQGKGDAVWTPSAILGVPSEYQNQLGAQINAPGAQGQQKATVQVQFIGKVDPLDKSDKPSKPGK